jgi:hypothetical protein
MAPADIARRVGILEMKVEALHQLPDQIKAVETALSDLRGEMIGLHSDLRAELRAELNGMRDELRVEIRSGDEETRKQMRMLHEDVIARLALIQEGHRNPKRPKPGTRSRRRH